MRFIVQFNRNRFKTSNHASWHIFAAQETEWIVVASTDKRLLDQVYYYTPRIYDVDGDFEGEADSLEQFFENNIEKFL